MEGNFFVLIETEITDSWMTKHAIPCKNSFLQFTNVNSRNVLLTSNETHLNRLSNEVATEPSQWGMYVYTSVAFTGSRKSSENFLSIRAVTATPFARLRARANLPICVTIKAGFHSTDVESTYSYMHFNSHLQ